MGAGIKAEPTNYYRLRAPPSAGVRKLGCQVSKLNPRPVQHTQREITQADDGALTPQSQNVFQSRPVRATPIMLGQVIRRRCEHPHNVDFPRACSRHGLRLLMAGGAADLSHIGGLPMF